MFLRAFTLCFAVLLLGVSAVSAQPRAPQVDAPARTAAAARLGRVIWTPEVRLDRAGIDPFVLRPSEAPGCGRPGPGCLPHYRPDFVVGGADVWMNLNEQLLVQLRGRAVADWYREFADQSGVAPDISQAVRYVAPRFHLDFGWRHAQSRRGGLTEVAQRVTRTAFDRRLTAAVRLGRFALETEWGSQRVRYARPAVAHPSFRYDWFDGDLDRWRHVLRPAVPGPSRWSFTFERVAQQAFHRPVPERRVRGTTVMLETELLTGLRLEGRVGVGWTHLVRPDYHRQLGRYSARTSAPVWRAELVLPSETNRLEFRLDRRFSQSVLPGPPSVSELRPAVPGPSRGSFTFERVAQQAFHRPLRERRVRGTTVMLETELLTGLRLEGHVGVGWTHLVRPDYHRQLGRYSARTSAPVWRAGLALPSEANRLEFRLDRRFSQSVLPGPPSVSELRADVRAGRRLGERLRADVLVQHGRIVYQDRIVPGTADRRRIDVLRIGAGLRYELSARWSVGLMLLRNSWFDAAYLQGLPDRTGSTAALTVHYAGFDGGAAIDFIDPWQAAAPAPFPA